MLTTHLCFSPVPTIGRNRMVLDHIIICRRNVARRAAAAEEVRLQPAKSGHTKVPTRTYELPNGKTAQVMADDYGFRTGSSRLYDEHYGEVPKGIFYMVRPLRCMCRLALPPHQRC